MAAARRPEADDATGRARARARAARPRRARGRQLVRPGEPGRRARAPRRTIRIGFTYPEDRYGVSRRRALRPAIRVGTLALRRAMVARVPAMIERAGAAALMLQHAVVSAAAVERAHGAGAAVWAWTVDDRGRARTARARPGSTRSSRTIQDCSGRWLHSPRETRTHNFPARGVRGRRSALRGPARRVPVGDRRHGHDDDGPTTTAPPPTTHRRRRRRPSDDHDGPDDAAADDPRRAAGPPRPSTIAAGVTVAGEVLVGGLSPAAATAEVKALLRAAGAPALGKVTLRVTPKQLGASAYVGDAIKQARDRPARGERALKVSAPKPQHRAVRGEAREAIRPRRRSTRSSCSATRSRS